MSGRPVFGHKSVGPCACASLALAAFALSAVAQTTEPTKPKPPSVAQPGLQVPAMAAPAKPVVSVQPSPAVLPKASVVDAATTPPAWPKTLPEAKAEVEARFKPDVYTPEEILVAKASCLALLKGLDVVVTHEPPIKSGNCGAPAPVQLISIGKNPQVALTPPATVTCEMVVTMHNWVTKDLQPLAKKHLGSSIIGLENMSSYSCRNAYGRKRTNLSEHGRANALDIRRFVTIAAKDVDLLADWGPTAREIKAQIAAAQAAAAVAKIAADKAATLARAKPTGQPGTSVPTGGSPDSAVASGTVGTIIEGIPGLASRLPGAAQDAERRSGFGLMRPSQLGGPKVAADPKVTPSVSAAIKGGATIDANSQAQKAQFLRNAHTTACQRFGTVLGPESNAAHRDHFHVDMAERANGNFCE